MNYYYELETKVLWKQKKSISQTHDAHGTIWILDKKEAKELAKKENITLNNKYITNLKTIIMSDKKGKKNKNKKNKNTNSSNSEQKSYSGSIALSKLKHVRMKKMNKKGKEIDCIVIPVKKNHLVEGKEGALYLPFRMIAKEEEDQYGQHGFISQSVDSKVYKDADENQREEFKKLPILGNIKCWNASTSSNDSAGSSGDVNENDDLPF